MLSKEDITDWFKNLQNSICSELEKADSKGKFFEDKWNRPEGGGGKTRIITNGNVIEKGGVNFSAVYGEVPNFILKELQNSKLETRNSQTFYATGISIVIHPHSPLVPIIHMNVRYFETDNGMCWFGGGIDLTPHYIVEEDATFFHNTLKSVCDQHDPLYYPEFKKCADDYFFIVHRNETRGIGGIFFDRLTQNEKKSKEDMFEFVKSVGSCFAPIYTQLMKKNKDLPYSDAETQWQLIRRGRYVEFNLIYDKGTKFGLETNGRTESILMSLPTNASWLYNHTPASGSKEEKTILLLKKGTNWV